jgi:glycosyltransferase involved in cell wall biosynthesis
VKSAGHPGRKAGHLAGAGAAPARDALRGANPALARNAPCPCRSGLRYKDCHGRLPCAAGTTDVGAKVGAAQARLAAGDVDAAEKQCREVLARIADHPEALRVLARCECERGHPGESLTLALRAARSMESFALPSDRAFLVWTDLNFMFKQALTGLDGEVAAGKRAEYASRPSAKAAGTPEVRVAVVIIARGDAGSAAASLASVSRQTWRDVELVIAMAGIDPREDQAFAAMVRECPFPIRWLSLPGASDAALADAGVRAAGGRYVNVLPAGCEFVPTRLETMVRETAAQASEWGFSGVAFRDAAGHPVGPEQDERVGAWAERLAAIPEADTIGCTLIHQVFVAVDAGNLFVSRSLYDRAGGFRDLPHTWAWDFCMRALWLAEPVHVPSAEYRQRVTERGAGGALLPGEREAAHVALFAEYYARACRDERVPPNPHAPSVAHWRMHFLKAVFFAGHVLALPLAELERLGRAVLERRAARRATAIEPGVDLIGFAYGEFGLAESLRALAKACLAGGIPFGVKDVELRIRTRQADRSIAAHVTDTLGHRCSVFCLNPDSMKPMRSLLVESAAMGRRNVGYWFWELERLPREWDYAIAAVDEIWVSTQFIADAVRRATPKPVMLIPAPIDVATSRPYTRAEFGLPNDRFLFLFSFDFNSFASRKNPEGAIAAFREAFAPARRDVGLVIKSINAANQPAKMRELRGRIGGDDRIVIVDGFFSRDQVSGLQTVVDAYLSLHRAEGLGLGLAESMYQGKPVIGTGYSGNLEFMNEQNSCLIDYRRVPIGKGEYICDDARFEWAEPDVGHAAQHMRRLVDDADFRVRIAARGQQDIRSRFTLAATAAAIRGRLEALGLL